MMYLKCSIVFKTKKENVHLSFKPSLLIFSSSEAVIPRLYNDITHIEFSLKSFATRHINNKHLNSYPLPVVRHKGTTQGLSPTSRLSTHKVFCELQKKGPLWAFLLAAPKSRSGPYQEQSTSFSILPYSVVLFFFFLPIGVFPKIEISYK